MKDLAPVLVIGVIAYLFYTGKASSLFSALSSAAANTSLPPTPFAPGQYTGPPVSTNVMEASLTPEQQVIETQKLLANQPGNVPDDTKLVFASYERNWAIQLNRSIFLTPAQWTAYRQRYIAAYGGETPNPDFSLLGVDPSTPISANDYLTRVNDYRRTIGKPSLGAWS